MGRCSKDGVAIVLPGLIYCAHHALLWYLRAAAEAA
jgi:hypothetical protein